MPDAFKFADNITAGLAFLPIGLSGDDDTNRFLSFYLDRYNQLQAPIENLLNYFLLWDKPGAQIPSWVLDRVGALLGCPRPTGLEDEPYRRVLLVQRIVRKSSGTAPDIRQVVKTIADYGTGGAIVAFLIPHTVIVTFGNFTTIAAAGLSLDIVIRLLTATIGDVDRLQIWDAVGNAFTWDVLNQGWGQAVWATPLYEA